MTIHLLDLLLPLAFFLLFPASSAREPFSVQVEPGSGDHSFVLMNLSAHPDDEDGATLAYYAKLKGVKTYSIFFTRGEGGQNEIGSQLYDDLGILRTQETEAAAKILGSEVYFLGFSDFGYSKTAKETFAKWGGKDSVEARLVYVIRALKPDVIITNHDTVTTKPRRQHGNHQAVGIAAFEAFEKAADPAFHPEQIHDAIQLWQPKKLYFRYSARDSGLIRDFVAIDVSQKTVEGIPITDFSLSALRQHRSQGAGQYSGEALQRYLLPKKYYLVKQARDFPRNATDLFGGIQPSPRETSSLDDRAWTPPPSKPRNSVPATTGATLAKNIAIGLVKSYDETTEDILKTAGIDWRLLDSSQLAAGDLSALSAIILDLRAYEYRHDAVRYNNRLLDYVRAGGNIVCLYHKEDDWNGKSLSPYLITLSPERVTEEDAAVTTLRPDHPFFTSPNRIVAADWDGWIQERNIYLPSDDTSKTSALYERLLSMSDTDERQPSTSLLWAAYGKGTYTYCSLALYRQLRIGNQGAMKLFFNMISQPRH